MIPVLLVAASLLAGQLPAPEAWDQADRSIMRLSPSAFPELPVPLRRALESRGCTIPQTYTGRQPHNVIRGSFSAPGQTDWAVLCSRDRYSSLLVFWGGSPDDVAEVAAEADRTYLQVSNPGEIGFSRAILVADPADIRRYRERHGGSSIPALTHDGIEDAFIEKASVVRYWHDDAWLELTGSD